MDGSKPMDVSALKGVKLSDTTSRMDTLAESLNSGDPIDSQKSFKIPEDFDEAWKRGKAEALKHLNSEESIRVDLMEQEHRLGNLGNKDSTESPEVINKFWKIPNSQGQGKKSDSSKTDDETLPEKNASSGSGEKVDAEEFFDDDLLEEECYDFAEKHQDYMEEEELNDAISEITGKLKLYPELDHIDYLKYLNNTEGIVKRDVMMYFRGVQKNNTCSVMSRSMELMGKLESVVAMSLKNSSQSTLNLKLSGEQLTKISQIKAENSELPRKKEEQKVGTPPTQTSEGKKLSPQKMPQPARFKRPEGEWKPKASIEERKEPHDNSLKIFRNIENPHSSLVVQELPISLNIQPVETPDMREERVKDFSKKIGITDRIIQNPKAWTVLFSVITDQMIDIAKDRDDDYIGKLRKAVLGKVSKAIQGA